MNEATDTFSKILEIVERCGYAVSTDTRKNLSGTVYFAIKGENFDGNDFVEQAIEKSALAAVTDNSKNLKEGNRENVFLVDDVLQTLHETARSYRRKFGIPIIAIGGSNGKSTSKELLRVALGTKYKTHATAASFNNHVGVPLSILAMPRDAEMGVFEIGANHPAEHTELLNILEPTHVVVTNNGLDHLEGFGSPEGIRAANKEIYDWAHAHGAEVFVHKKHSDLMEDSETITGEEKHEKQIVYPSETDAIILNNTHTAHLAFVWNTEHYKTKLIGNYNLENIELAFSIAKHFGAEERAVLHAISEFTPLSKRSELVEKDGNTFIVDCYNANPTSMQLALDSFLESADHPNGVILGDMLELGIYAEAEHAKTAEYVLAQKKSGKLDCIIFIGPLFQKALNNQTAEYHWFPNSETAQGWFSTQTFFGFTFLLKGSRSTKVEKIIGL